MCCVEWRRLIGPIFGQVVEFGVGVRFLLQYCVDLRVVGLCVCVCVCAGRLIDGGVC